MAKRNKPTDRRLRQVIGDQAFGGRGRIPTARSQRIALGKANPLLHAEGLTNPKIASGNGAFDDARDLARRAAFAAWRKAYSARVGRAEHDDT